MEKTQESVSLMKELAPYIGPFVVLLVFIGNQWISYHFRKIDARRNWYMKVLIEPNIKKIDEFYGKVFEGFKTAENELQENTSKNVPVAEFNQLKAKLIGDFQTLKRDFEFNFVELISTSEDVRLEEINPIMISLEDKYTEAIDRSQTIGEVTKQIAKNKASLLKILYEPIKQKRFVS